MPGKKKAQSALEYLMTYGWALVMIATIVGILASISGGGINANTCTTFLSIICKGVGADGDTLILVLQNTTGQKITINPFLDIKFDDKEGYAIVTYKGNVYRFEDVTINSGEEFTISAKGMALTEEVSITYTERATGIRRTVTSKLSTDAPDTIELSNDGIDNDEDGLIDCQDPSLSNCEYNVESPMVGGPIIVTNGAYKSVQFLTLEGAGGTPITSSWNAHNSVALVFYVSSFTPGTTANARFGGPVNNTTINLKQGWNTAEIPLAFPQLAVSPTGNILDPEIISNGADFTISDNPAPKIFLTLNP